MPTAFPPCVIEDATDWGKKFRNNDITIKRETMQVEILEGLSTNVILTPIL
jgi:hypothetical protein